ncbi:hypothetical protein [Amycolatopsis sp. PS_44_ISF1]|uniref:hypothetical protein n=1 Tax=Amycolatopsis sp. PS_44_ISF1 TaxID=2974917 RepID=UPI0037C0DA1C
MSGAPESHLGIRSREFQTPCVMTAHLTGGETAVGRDVPDDVAQPPVAAAAEEHRLPGRPGR